jgi:hypothetical protein
MLSNFFLENRAIYEVMQGMSYLNELSEQLAGRRRDTEWTSNVTDLTDVDYVFCSSRRY